MASTSQVTELDLSRISKTDINSQTLSYNKRNNYYSLCLEMNLQDEVRLYCLLLLFHHLHTQFSFKCRLNLPLRASYLSDLKILYLDTQICVFNADDRTAFSGFPANV